MVPNFNRKRLACGGVCLLMMFATQASAEDPAPTATEKFFAQKVEGAHASVVLRQISPLFGGREYYVSAEGRLVIVDIRRDELGVIEERRFEIDKLEKELGKIFELLLSVDILDTPLEEEEKPGPTCSNPPLVIFRNAAGDVHAVPTIQHAPTKAYDDVLMAIAALMQHTRGVEPTYTGTLDTTFVPKGFEWTAPILANGKAVSWAPHASPADLIKAEQEYQKKVRLQLKIIEAKKREALTPVEKNVPASEKDKTNKKPSSENKNKSDDK